jgi:tetratricopeptide (TPR) repeat protein
MSRQADRLADAEPLATRAVDGRRRTLGPDHKDTIAAMTIQLIVFFQEKKLAEAQRVGDEAYALARRTLGEQDRLTGAIGTVLQQVALQRAAPTREEQQRVLSGVASGLAGTRATSLPELIQIAASRATVAAQQGKPEEAIAALLDAMEASRRAGQEEWSLTAILAGIYALQNKLDEAQQTLAPVLARAEPGRDLMPNVLPFALRTVGGRLRDEKRFAEAERYYDALLPIVLVTPGDAAAQTRVDAALRADVYAAQGKFADAERFYAQVVEMQRRAAGGNAVATYGTQSQWGWTQMMLGRLADAERTLRDAFDALSRVSPVAWERHNTAGMLGAALAQQQRYAEAEPLLVTGWEGMANGAPLNANIAARMTRQQVGEALLALYTATNNSAKRAEWQDRLRK